MGNTCIIHKDMKNELLFDTPLESVIKIKYPEVDK